MPKRILTSTDARLHALVGRHLDLLVAELAGELRRNIADEIEAYFRGASAPAAARAVAKPAKAAKAAKAPAAPAAPKPAQVKQAKKSKKPKKAAKVRKIVPCIAPDCSNPSKGPRFHYLCDKHKDASKKEYDGWRAAKRSAA
ncbi:MAG: hypothetical protein EXR73_03420 [Myxococcales bacterium]|nr:hypothetical protein [Myxococcales bacterium]